MKVIIGPIHVDDKEKEHIKSRAVDAGVSMSAIIRGLIQADMKKVKK